MADVEEGTIYRVKAELEDDYTSVRKCSMFFHTHKTQCPSPFTMIFQVGEYTSVASCGPVDLSEGALRSSTPVATETTTGDVQIPILTELGQVEIQEGRINCDALCFV